MNKLLICAFHLRRHRPASGKARLHIVTGYPVSDCRRMLAPWSEWTTIVSCGATAPAEHESGDIVLATEPDGAQLKSQWEGRGARVLLPEFPPAGTLDADFLREVSFFDFEFSGKNEWDGSPTLYAPDCLQKLSATHCRESYPFWAFADVAKRGRPLKVMDIGCGIISMLRWGAVQGDISITGVDPILDMYALSLARHGFDAMEKIRCDREVNGFAEELDKALADDDYDVIYTRNALDHTQQPLKVLENIGLKLAPGGVAAIHVATKEGTRQQWDQLHKTDIWLERGVLKFAHQDGVAKPLLTPSSRLHLKRVELDTPDWLAVILEKR